MPLSQEILETIKSRISISALVSRYLPIVNKNSRTWVVCPFHDDKNPSMILNDDRGSFYCFGCQTRGNIFDFLMLYEHITFYQAVERLARECNVEIRPETEQDRVLRSRREQLYNIYTILSAEYMYQLGEKSPGAKRADNYLGKRAITSELRKKFLIGYAPDDIQFTQQYLHKRGFEDDVIFSAGLFSAEKKFPYFVDRLVFPIFNLSGKPIAFSARRMKDDNTAKYINSSETEIFKKGEILYGFYQAIESLKKKNPCIVVEGNFDVLTLHSINFTNAVATCGTALTDQHIELIRRYTDKIILFFDRDDAGVKATQKAIYNIYRNGLKCSIALLSAYKDASEALENGDTAAIKNAVGKDAQSPENFLFGVFSSQKDVNSISYKSEVVSDFAKFAALLDIVQYHELVQFLSTRLVLPNNLVEQYLNSFVKKEEEINQASYSVRSIENAKAIVSNPPAIANIDEQPLFETDLMKMLVVRREYLSDEAFSYVGFSDLKNNKSRLIYKVLVGNPCALLDDDEFLLSIKDEKERVFFSQILQEYGNIYRSFDENKIENMILNSVKRIIRNRIKNESANLNMLSRIDNADSILLEKNRRLVMLGALNRSISESNTES